ncbi:hypothetical protein SEUCBS139899_004305 [Sporothrix eucalyptigena]|uniref:NAD binding Rossmann fold oxidoreductase n=1 Tax=Sporothrix eucalyptigena TaxID=1812306 RepID=A0ABP0BSI0_9PEZI
MPAPIKTAILGTGIGVHHLHWPLLKSLPSYFEVTTILERKQTGVAKALTGGTVKVVATLDEVINSDVELIIVATSDDTHFEIIKKILNAGKQHVLGEKPLTYHAAQSAELQELAKAKGRVLGVFQSRRFDGDYLTAKKLIENNTLGSVTSYEVFYSFYRPASVAFEGAAPPEGDVHWKDNPALNRGNIYTIGAHTIDQIYTLFGMPDKILGRTWSVRGNGVQDSFEATFIYPPRPGTHIPLCARATTNLMSPVDPQLRFVVKATKGAYVKYYEDNQWYALQRGEANADTYGTEIKEHWGTATLVQPDGSFKNEVIPTERGDYRQVYRELASAIWANDPSKNSVQVSSVIQATELIELAHKSAKEDRYMFKGKDY